MATLQRGIMEVIRMTTGLTNVVPRMLAILSSTRGLTARPLIQETRESAAIREIATNFGEEITWLALDRWRYFSNPQQEGQSFTFHEMPGEYIFGRYIGTVFRRWKVQCASRQCCFHMQCER
jgi:hypothetical protein